MVEKKKLNLSKDLVDSINKQRFCQIFHDDKKLYISFPLLNGRRSISFNLSDIKDDTQFIELLEKKVNEISNDITKEELVKNILYLEGVCSRIILRIKVSKCVEG